MIISVSFSSKIKRLELNVDRFLTFVFVTKHLSEPLQSIDQFGCCGGAEMSEAVDCGRENGIGLFQVTFVVDYDAESRSGCQCIEVIRTGSTALSLQSRAQMVFGFVEFAKKAQ